MWKDELHKMLLDGIVTLVDIGFNHIEINDIVLNNRMKTTLGCYYHDKKLIEISTKHFKYSDKEEVMNTIIHELSHNICDLKYGSNMINNGHSKEWEEIAEYISNNTKYKITQYSEDNTNFKSIPKTEYFIHYLKCDECNYTDSLISKFQDYDKVKKKKKCIACEVANNRVNYMDCIKTYHDHYKYSV